MVTITRTSPLTGKVNTMELDLTPEQFTEMFDAWQDGTLIQNAFPTLTIEEREFIKTGATQEDWDTLFGSEEEAE